MLKKGIFIGIIVSVLGVFCGAGLFFIFRPTVTKQKITSTEQKIIKNNRVDSSSEKDIKKQQEEIFSVFNEPQVVKEAVYPKMTADGSELSENILPVGAIVNVKSIDGNSEQVEIISDPAKGFIDKKILEPRQKHVAAREAKRQPNLTVNDVQKKLDDEIAAFLANKGGDVSVFIETVDKSFSYNYNGDKINRTASSIKLPFISYLMTLADQGKIDLETELTFLEHNRMDGTGIIQFEPAGKSYTLEQLAELTIRYSDNVAYVMLLNHLGESNFIQFLSELDSNSPNNRVFSTPQILTKAMAYVHKKSESQPETKMRLLYDWLQQSIFDDGVAIGLPGVDVSHKTGWMPKYMVSNDIALVHDKERPYYITIMTNGYDDTYSEQAISDLSQILDTQLLQLK
ncbi:serine hydrolase [Vagococcus vulneris]|uniref:Beta-lactamase class A catalytic domain-containing protein n=1 Tax=Vagococcus vulneris TaxID=1977869 RepID=A0A430A1I0_9ENTE|nr:serine hydrolase [Vagococcus vulneris]RSU00224.1 hypothetical protein CBF37_02700 [Vagococcus vulneris]